MKKNKIVLEINDALTYEESIHGLTSITVSAMTATVFICIYDMMKSHTWPFIFDVLLDDFRYSDCQLIGYESYSSKQIVTHVKLEIV